jgi:hypothetical protein
MGSKKSKKAGDSGPMRSRLAHIRSCEKSGESLKAYAERHGLSVHGLYQAKKLARQEGLLPPHRGSGLPRKSRKKNPAPVRFAEAVVGARDLGAVPSWRLRLPTGVVIESHTALEPDQLLHLIRALRGDE